MHRRYSSSQQDAEVSAFWGAPQEITMKIKRRGMLKTRRNMNFLLVASLTFLWVNTDTPPFDNNIFEGVSTSLSSYSNYLTDMLFESNIAKNITIYISGNLHENDSIFRTNTLQHYGTGRFDFIVIPDAVVSCDDTLCKEQSPESETNNNVYQLQPQQQQQHSAPCLVVSKYYSVNREYCQHDGLRCNFPRCKTMIEGDEWCRVDNFDVRHYYSTSHQGLYLPLGPRLDAWTSLQNLRELPDFVMKPSSLRRYAANAIFTFSTGEGRKHLAKVLNGGYNTTLPMFLGISEKWLSMTNVHYAEVKTDSQAYMEVLLDSIFTLSPAGHSPECFRLFEAVEAGSIPVLVNDDLYMTNNGACLEPLLHWYDAPILVVNSWDEVFPTIENMLSDMVALDKMQSNLREWYDTYMRRIVRSFEDYLMQPPINDPIR